MVKVLVTQRNGRMTEIIADGRVSEMVAKLKTNYPVVEDVKGKVFMVQMRNVSLVSVENAG